MGKGSDIMHDEENCRYISNKKIIQLTETDSYILKLLLENKGKVVRFKKQPYIQIHRLREKLKGEVNIKTKNKIGYYIDY